jgi:ribonuclease HI
MELIELAEQKILNLEKQLLTSETRHSEEELSCLLHENFIEFGSSGKIYSRADVIEALSNEQNFQLTISDFRIRKLSDNSVLALYKTISAGKTALRSSIWLLDGEYWRMIFHQGTPIQADF